MKKKIAKAVLQCLALLLVVSLSFPSAYVLAAEPASDALGGACGDHATWDYDPTTKTLTIRGTGSMWDYHQGTYINDTPWNRFKGEIEKIVIDYGITAIGRYAFCYMEALKELEFVTNDGETTVETIGGYSFCWNETLKKVVLPEGVRFISGRAFSRVENVEEIWLPSTLESVDMYAFMSNDPKTSISKVYYNGTKADWDRVYVSTQGDNDKYLLPDKDTTWVYLKEYTDYADVSEYAWYKDAVYYLKDQGMVPDSGTFGVTEVASIDWVLPMLYIRAGSIGAYDDALDWAKQVSIVPVEMERTDATTLDVLCNILYRTALYNGNAANLGNGTALEWCKSMAYIPAQLHNPAADAVLTRAQAAAVLASFLRSDNGYADRYDDMCAAFRAAYEAGGDGNMYILALHHGGTGKVGDATAILLPGGETMLIDTFRSDGWVIYLKTALEQLGIKKLDYLVLSHGHGDHDANLLNVINYVYNRKYTIENYWSAGATTSNNEKLAIQYLQFKGGVNIQKNLRAGEQLTIGSGETRVTVDILWPKASGTGYSGDSNNGSLTMKLTYGNSSYLTGGDLFMDGELAILDMYKNNPELLKADVMKTNHHGSYSSNHREWVAAVDPAVMITHSDDSGDSAQCYEYSQDGSAWYSAGRDGGVLVIMDSQKNITVTTRCDTNLRQYLSCG